MCYVTILYYIDYFFCVYVPLLYNGIELKSISVGFSVGVFTDS